MLSVREISFAYNERLILNDISLSLRRGEFLGFLGPNGSGKSTFLKNLLGFLKPIRGRIVFYGGDTSPETGEPDVRFAENAAFRMERSRNRVPGIFFGVKGGLRGRLTTLLPSVSRFSR